MMPVIALLAVLAAAPAPARPAAPAPLQVQAQAPAIGRLFSTPDERAVLDGRRQNGTLSAAGAAAPQQAAAAALNPTPPAAPAPLTVNGVVRRSSGKSTIWVNQVALDDQSGAFAPGQPGVLRLQSANGQQVLLKPGQRYDLERGVVSEANGR